MSTTKATIVSTLAEVMLGRAQKSRVCPRNITTNAARLVIESDAHAQNTLPKAFPMLATPTMPAAAAALTWASSWNNGDSCEITEIPAEVFKNRSSQRAHHCQVLSASPSVWSRLDRWEVCDAVGTQPSGFQPSGGFC